MKKKKRIVGRVWWWLFGLSLGLTPWLHLVSARPDGGIGAEVLAPVALILWLAWKYTVIEIVAIIRDNIKQDRERRKGLDNARTRQYNVSTRNGRRTSWHVIPGTTKK